LNANSVRQLTDSRVISSSLHLSSRGNLTSINGSAALFNLLFTQDGKATHALANFGSAEV